MVSTSAITDARAKLLIEEGIMTAAAACIGSWSKRELRLVDTQFARSVLFQKLSLHVGVVAPGFVP